MVQIYIKYASNTLTINTGFRGSPVTIINNSGFEYTDDTLEFDDTALRYACNTRFSSRDTYEIERYLRNNPTDDVPILVRNLITIYISSKYCIMIENVNSFNLQPCRMKLMVNNTTKSARDIGILSGSGYFTGYRLSSLTDESYLIDSTSTSTEITQTTDSVYTNKAWE